MQNYTPATATYSDTIRIVESTDAVNDTNANAAAKQLIENDIALKAELDAILENGTKVNDVSGATATSVAGSKSVSLIWSDPDDVVVSGATLATWKGTKLVKKAGSAPTDVTDGTVILDNQVRNAYASSAYVDNNVEYGTTYYYRFFPYTTLGAVTKGTSVTVTPAKGTVTEPTVSGSFTYDGTEKTASVTAYDPAIIEITGLSATNAGTYTATLHIIDNDYTWSDNTSADKTQTWTIAKAAGSATLTPSTVELGPDNLSDTIAISDATGTVSGVTSSDTDVCTASLSGSTVTVTSVDDKTGTATITVSIAASANYEAATEEATVKCTFTSVYGVEWDGSSSPAMSRTDDAVGFTDPVPAVNNGNGSSPFDTLMPWAGMEIVDDANAGKLVKIPKFWFKLTINDSTGAMKLQIADGPQEGFSVSPAHQDRGDGAGERDYVYVGRYHCGATAYKSASGQKPKASVTRANFRTSIHNLGSDIWQWDKMMLETIQMLYLVEYAHFDSQVKIGYGCGNNSATENMGSTDSMTYHTGTNAASRTTYGHTQYRHIEDLWGNVYDWLDGVYLSSGKAYFIKNPANFSDSTGGTYDGFSSTFSNEIKRFRKSAVTGFEWVFWPAEVVSNSNYDTYICDFGYVDSSSVGVYVGGYVQGRGRGLFCQGSYSAAYSSAGIGSRLQKLPSA